MMLKLSEIRECITRLLLLCTIVGPCMVGAQFTITESFKGSNVGSNIILGGDARLTSGNADPVNNGWLRLTTDANRQNGYAYINNAFPSSYGIYIEFEYKTWRSSGSGGADGFSVFLFNAATSPFRIGAYGGSLGYANLNSGSTNIAGLAGAYLGIGFDEYGNFAAASEGKAGGTANLTPSSVVLRGATNLPAPTSSYRYLGSVQTTQIGTKQSVDYTTATTTRPTDAQFYRRVKIYIDPIGTSAAPRYRIRVFWRPKASSADELLIDKETTDPIPAMLKMGFAGSTGGSVNFHEIRNLLITTTGGVRVQKEVDKTTALPGEELTYTVNVYNETQDVISNLGLTDIVRDGNNQTIKSSQFTLSSITFNNNGNTGTTATGFISGTPKTSGLTNPLSSTLALAANSYGTFVIKGKVNSNVDGGAVNNSVSLDVSNIGVTDPDLTNNQATVSTTILNPNVDLKIEKGVNNNGEANANGNVFSIVVSNVSSTVKPAGKTVTVTDALPAGLTGGTATGSGWTITKKENTYTFTRADKLDAQYAYPTITIPVTPSTNGPWTNTATLSYADDTNTANNTATATLRALVCFNDPVTTGTALPTRQGITLLKRAGAADTDKWPMSRNGGHLALESNSQGFVVTRSTTTDLSKIISPQEGMMVYDTTAKCLKIYSSGSWKCFNTPTCP
ncbi:MAG: DUF11 domain-containing protein [Chryseobacterium sp.]|nr:MAG: DUF11 domain-containing protein [Chryseobacterium sp.]